MTDTAAPAFSSAFTIADEESLRGQRWHLLLLRVELLMLIFGAGFAIFQHYGQPKTAGVGAAISFVLAIVVRSFRIANHPDRNWQDGRAMAESVKTLCWKYAMRANPFPSTLSEVDADRLFVERIQDMLRQVDHLSMTPATVGESQQVTQWMRAVRAAPLIERQETYEATRLLDQQRWYASRAKASSRNQLRWAIAILLFEACGAVVAILLIDDPEIPHAFLGLAAAFGAAAGAWVQARQFGASASAYTIAHQELAAIRAMLDYAIDETAWAEFVDSAEGAISREHTMWQASRSSMK
ncbi:DUF4231 domain-containing protein [soil metagenome]